MQKSENLVLSSEEAASSVGISTRQARKLRKEGRFPQPVNIDGRVRFRRSDIEEWVRNLETTEAGQ